MIDDGTSIFDKENRSFLIMLLIEIAIIVGVVIGACLGK